MLVAAVRGEVQQVDDLRPRALGGHRVEQRLAEQAGPELQGVGHVPGEVDEVGVVEDVVAGQGPDRGEDPYAQIQYGLAGQLRQSSEQGGRAGEADGQQRGVELPGGGLSPARGGAGGGVDGDAQAPGDDEGLQVAHRCTLSAN
ncbi:MULTISPECIES: hypothetical protein [Nonomuraea]|uniref:Uncharacterized protein n=1 Tax=Nonomuraea ferruginea TaxID=46174 RepID=A0ABT4T5F7_9ACTN|nr:hypothetical protein [Nonomuraea ferruginea]MDA0644747.1 hypothetical protein [Nonomuraea ferruginea]